MSILSTGKYVPDTLAELTAANVFPKPLPEAFYSQMLKDYESVTDVETSWITYESDGLKITGLSAVPKHLAPGGHPILIYNRGGSREYGRLSLLSAMRSMIPFARKGWLVFASNYRGCHGSEGREEFGGAELADIAGLIHAAQSHPGFDGKNRFMLGHSRGGMMTYLALKSGMALNAAISIAGIADLFEQEHWMKDKVFARLIPGYPEKREAALAARSAIRWPEKLTAPLLLLHGTADEAVPHTQSERLAARLSNAELQLYPQGNHALVRQWDDVLARCLGWMEAHRA